jgi:hypothetical protein
MHWQQQQQQSSACVLPAACRLSPHIVTLPYDYRHMCVHAALRPFRATMQHHEEAAWPETYSQEADHQAALPPAAAPKQPHYSDAARAAAAGGDGAPPRKLAGPLGAAPAASQRPRQQAAGQGPRSGRSRFQTMSVMSGASG